MTEQKAEYKIEGRPATIFRTIKCPDNPYVMVDQRPILNEKLSWKAKGILVYLLSRPDGWEVNLVDLSNRSADGISSVKAGVKELKEAGHLKHAGIRRESGQFDTVIWEVYEAPQVDNQLTDNPQVGVASQATSQTTSPQVEKPQADKPQADNRTQVLSTLSNNELIYNTRELSKEKIKEITEKTEARILKELQSVQEHEASGTSWSGREKLPEPIRDLLDTYVQLTGQKPLRGQLMDWLGTGNDWLEIGATKVDIDKAFQESKPNEKGFGGFACYRPGSLTGAIQKVVGQRRAQRVEGSKLERALAELGELTQRN